MLFQFYGAGRFGPLSQAIVTLEQLGILDSLIPFAIIFAVIYQVLQQTGIFYEPKLDKDGKPKAGEKTPAKKVNAVIGMSVALMTVVPHVLGYYSPTSDPVIIMARIAPEVALIVLALVLASIMAGILGTGANAPSAGIFGKVSKYAGYISLGLIGLVFTGALLPPGQLPGFLNFIADPFVGALLIAVLFFGGVGYLVVGGGPSDGTGDGT